MKIKNIGQYEIVDRTHVFMESIDANLYSHYAITKKQKKKVNKAMWLLMEVYQSAAEKAFKDE